jgi:hypothetical protein
LLKTNCNALDGRSPTDDYSAFNEVWDKPDGGMHKYLHRFLTSPDATFQHIAVWTIVQLLESGGMYTKYKLFSMAQVDCFIQILSSLATFEALVS